MSRGVYSDETKREWAEATERMAKLGPEWEPQKLIKDLCLDRKAMIAHLRQKFGDRMYFVADEYTKDILVWRLPHGSSYAADERIEHEWMRDWRYKDILLKSKLLHKRLSGEFNL